MKQDLDGKRFVTARAWEDLSKIMQVYEELHYPLEEKLMAEYLADEEVAKDFALYYDLYCKYREIYHVPDILAGKEIKDVSLFVQAPFDEKIRLAIPFWWRLCRMDFIVTSRNKKNRSISSDS